MPRIRTIKPEFWTDGDIVDLSAYARLLFIGSWNFTLCDRGHVADDPKRLKMQVLPADDVDAAELIEEIINHGRMVRVTTPDGRTFLHIKRFTDHQKIEKRWTPRCPACEAFGLNDASLNLPETPRTSREVERGTASLAETRAISLELPETRPTSAPEGKGKEGKGVSKPAASRGTRVPDIFPVTDDMRAWATENTPDVPAAQATAEFVDYWRAVPGAKGVKLDWQSTWRNHMRKRQQWADEKKPTRPAGGRPRDQLAW